LSRLRERLRRAFRRDIAKDTVTGFSYEGALLFSSLLSFGLLGRSLGPTGFGDYASLYAIATPLITLASTGVALAQAQHVVREHEDLETTTRSCLALSICGGVLMTIVGTGLALLIIDGLPLRAILPIYLLEFVSFPAVLIAANTIQAVDGYASATPVRVVPIVFRIAIILVLFGLGHLTIVTLGVTYLIVTAIIGAVLMVRTGRRYGIRMLPGRIHTRHLKSSLVYSFGVSGMAVQNDGDKTVLQAYGYKNDVGLYSAGYKIVQLGLLPVNTFMSVTHNRFLTHDEQAQGQHLRRSLQFGGVCALYGAVFGLAIAVVAPYVTSIIVGNEFEGAATVVRWLAPLVLLRSLAIFPLNGLMGLGYTRLRTILLVASAVLSIGLFVALVPLLQWKGAAIGTLVGEAALALASWIALVKLERKHDRAKVTAPHDVLATTPEPATSGAH
jgi:O-antigen/teichoic acid export membrane protein